MKSSRLWPLLLTACTLGASADERWFDFTPAGPLPADSVLNLRHLNEPVAGGQGFVTVANGHFVLGGSGEPVRFWGVNGPSPAATTPEALREEAALLASYGVNLVRVHGPLYDAAGTLDPEKIQRCIEIAEAMKHEGIYVLYSIYFPLWLKPAADHAWLRGYDGSQHPFAALMFNPEFQARYREWWRALLLTPSRRTGRRLVDEPAVLAAEIQNEDSYFFWTFNEKNLPAPQRVLLERAFATWLRARHGSLEQALAAWGSAPLAGDDLTAGRIAFRPLGQIVNERSRRDQDTVAFLLEHQRQFYAEQQRYLRELGFKGLITFSNWITADPAVLGPLEKLSYTGGDFIDRHGYFSSGSRGPYAEWSIRPGHTYRDRSAYRFDPENGSGKPVFVHPSMDPTYQGLPSMISETTWNRPNRFRSEAPLAFATYGALQDTDAIVHFAFDGAAWSVQPNYWMQPWTLMSPAMMGQFPAAARLYRQGRVQPGAVLADLTLGLDHLLQLRGSPLAPGAALDDLRKQDVATAHDPAAAATIDPLIHYAGRTQVQFADRGTAVNVQDLAPWIDHANRRVTATTGEVVLDYGDGFLRLQAPSAQGVSGRISAAGEVDLPDLRIASPLELGHIVLVSLDEQPIASSSRLLLQVMSEERPTGFTATTAPDGAKTITAIGTDPWQVKQLAGTVHFKFPPDALRVTALTFDGRPDHAVALEAGTLKLLPATMYYLVERKPVSTASLRSRATEAIASLAPGWSTRAGSGVDDAFYRVTAPKPATYLELPLGRIAGLKRFTSGYRFVPFWMKPAVGTDESQVRPETQWLLAETDAGSYLLIAPLLDDATRFSLRGGPEGLVVVAETGDPLLPTSGGEALYVAQGDDPYALLQAAAQAVSRHLGAGRLRTEKPVPDFVDLFGWCTWDAFYHDVSPDKVRTGLASFAAGGVTPRLLILDDGWQSVRTGAGQEIRLTSLAPNERFGGDLTPLVAMAKEEYGVQRVLVWHALMGYWGGLDEELLATYGPRTVARSFGPGVLAQGPTWNVQPWGAVVGVPDAQEVGRFYDDYHRSLAAQGVDGVKVDNQAMLEAVSAGQGGRVATARLFRAGLEASVNTHFDGRLINCMSSTTEAAYLAAGSTVMRTSDDFWPRKPETHGAHVFINAHASLWFGEFILPDWDMFQSGHAAGAFHAAARALSGGPVYVSDKPGEHDFDLLRKLVLSDGTVLRADFPGRLAPDSLMVDPTREPVLLKIFNHNRDAGVIGLFNARYHADPSDRTALTGHVSPADIPGLTGDAFAAFAHRADRVWRATPDQREAFTLAEGEWEIVTYAPIERGFAALGLSDKLNSSGAVTNRRWQGDTCTVALRDGGRFIGWAKSAPVEARWRGTVQPLHFDAATGRVSVDLPEGGPGALELRW